MADEENKNDEKTEKPEETPEEPKADETPEEAPAKDAPAEEPKAEEATAEEEPAEQPAAEGGEPSETPDTPAGAAEEVGGDDDQLSWKAQRRLERSRQPAEAKPQQTPEERAAARTERRAANTVERRRYRQGRRAKREKGTGTPPAERDAVARKIRRGTVVSSKADKTITVRIDVARRHPAYEKVVRKSSTLHAHDERNEAGDGDLVQVVETRPLSRTKRWRLTEVLEKAK